MNMENYRVSSTCMDICLTQFLLLTSRVAHMTRLVLATTLLSMMPAVVIAQDVDTLKSGVVRIRNTYSQDGGTGFIIKIDGERAYVITASHVVKNNEHPSVYLYNKPSVPVQATLTYREDDEQKGLALLEIKAKKETFSNLAPVGLRGSSDLKGGEQVHVIGFPDGAIIWSVSLGNISRLEARNLIFTAPVRTGNSGSPVFYNGLVVGLVTDADPGSVYAVRSEGIFEYLSGLNAKLAESVKPSIPTDVKVPNDKSEFCRALTRIVDSSREGFFDIVKGGYDSTVVVPGLKSGRVSPETQEASYYNFISDPSKARSQYYELIANAKRCLSDWKVLENNGRSRPQMSRIDAPITVFLYHKDGTLVTVEQSKVTSDYMVQLSVYSAKSTRQRFQTGNEIALAFAFTETEADRQSVCQGLKKLVDASHQDFTSIVGKPGFLSGYFEASIKIPGFPSIDVRRREDAYMRFNAEDLSEVEALNDRLVGILTNCFPAWTAEEVKPQSAYDQTTQRFRLTEADGSVFELTYDSRYDASAHALYLHLYPRGSAPRLR